MFPKGYFKFTHDPMNGLFGEVNFNADLASKFDITLSDMA